MEVEAQRAVGRLAGGVAHDFNNLLAAIMAYADMALEDAGSNPGLSADLEHIREAVTRATALTGQLLALSRSQLLRPRPLDVGELLQGMARLLQDRLGARIQLTISTAPELRPIHADPEQLQQVVLSLAASARDAMPEGGTLTIGAANGEACVMLSVSDSGAGMDGATCERVFEPFGAGRGLELAAAQGIVLQSGGSIRVESQPGQGTTFRITLPAAIS